MAHIKWESAGIQTAMSTAKRLGADAAGCAASVKQARSALDWQVGSAAGIDQKLQQLNRRLTAAQSGMETIARAAGSAASLSQTLDTNAKREVGQIAFSVSAVSIRSVLSPASAGNFPSATQVPLPESMLPTSVIGAASVLPKFADLFPNLPWNDDPLDTFLAQRKFLDKVGEGEDGPFIDAINYFRDGYGIGQALMNQDGDALAEYVVKYAKKGATALAKTVDGMSSISAKLYFELGRNFTENLLDLGKYSKDGASLAGFAGYAVHVTVGTLLETGGNIAFDMIKDAFKIVGLDYKKWSGYSQFTDIYKDWQYIGGVIAEQAPKVLKNTVQAVGNVVSGTVSAVGGFFSKLFK